MMALGIDLVALARAMPRISIHEGDQNGAGNDL